jgi:drug/metabolite transporter (DMT)-like permease
MSVQSLWLILLSACIHVVAHVALKRTRNRDAFVWWMLLWGGLTFAPVVLLRWQPIPVEAAGLILLSAVFEAGYFFAIAQAYRRGDLSLVYPLARGTAPVLLILWSVLILAERPTLGGALGVGLIAAGLYCVNLPGLGAWAAPLRAMLHEPASRWALSAGLCISLYTAVDRVGIRFLDPLQYTWLALWVTWLLLTPGVLWRRGRERLRTEWRASRFAIVLAGFTTLAAYAIVLFVMQTGTPASYAGAAREVSVVLGAAIGVWLLKETGTVMRAAGAVLIAAGVAVIKLLG